MLPIIKRLFHALAALTYAAAATFADPVPIVPEECDELLPGVGTVHWISVGGADCANADFLIVTGDVFDSWLPEVIVTQETDGRYNVSIFSEADPFGVRNDFTIEPQHSGVSFNMLRVIRHSADADHDATLRLDAEIPVLSVDLLGEIVLTDDPTNGYADVNITLTSFGEPAVSADVGLLGVTNVGTFRIGGNLGSEELPPDVSGGLVREYVSFLQVNGSLLGEFTVSGSNGNDESIGEMIVQGRMGLENPNPQNPFEIAAGDLRTEGSIRLLTVSEVGPAAEIVVGPTAQDRMPIGELAVTTEFSGSGDFNGTLDASTVFIAGGATYQVQILGDLSGKLIFREPIADHFSGAPVIRIDGDFAAGAEIQLPADGLEGQIVVNRAFLGDVWESGALVKVGSSITLTGPSYSTQPSTLGGGAVGEAAFRLHRNACDPPYDPFLLRGAELDLTDCELVINGTLVDCQCEDVVTLEFYGPVDIIDAQSPGAIKIEYYGELGWENVSSDFSIEESSANRRRIEIRPYEGWLLGSYRMTRVANRVKCAEVAGAPDVAPFTYILDTMSEDCEESLLGGFDQNFDFMLSLGDDLPAWAASPTDLNGDSAVDGNDPPTLANAVAEFAGPSGVLYYQGPWE